METRIERLKRLNTNTTMYSVKRNGKEHSEFETLCAARNIVLVEVMERLSISGIDELHAKYLKAKQENNDEKFINGLCEKAAIIGKEYQIVKNF